MHGLRRANCLLLRIPATAKKILDIFEATTGGRLIQNYNTIGGVQADIAPDFVQKVKDFIAYLRPTIKRVS